MSKIEKNLEKLYSQHRIVVWYDPDRAFEEELAELILPDVSVVIITNNELAIKHQILLQQPQQKFLLYMPYSRPTYDLNWLLDIELSQKLFHTDQESMLLQELELPFHHQSWLKKQSIFFKSKERKQKFSALLNQSDSQTVLNNKLIQVLFGSVQHDTDQLVRDYVKAFVQQKSDVLKDQLEKFGLEQHFWEEVHIQYDIENDSKNIYDFLLKMFKYSFKPICGEKQILTSARIKLSNWKDLRSFSSDFDSISSKVAHDLHLEAVLEQCVLEDLLEEDLFELIDKKIIVDLIKKVTDHTFNGSRVEEIIKRRESKHWYGKYGDYYQAILKATQLLEEIMHIDWKEIKNIETGLSWYSNSYFKIDQWYRQFISLLRSVDAGSILQPLYEEVDKIYSNRWLLELSDHWQHCVDKNKEWYFGPKSQFNFFDSIIKAKYINQKRKVFVIISDALRYEIGEELHRTINQQNRFESKLDYQVTGLPSYTQLGMASMLPHSEISLGESDDIFIDGMSSKGMEAREKILNRSVNIKAAAISAEELASYKVRSEEARELMHNNDVVYVYHNVIDKTGDDKISEEKVFDAVKEEMEFLLALIKRISSINITHIVITADHGFIYQNEALQESDFADAAIEGKVTKSNRRFVIGHNLKHNDAVVKYDAKSLRINSNADILIPKGINRLRIKGAGSRFIHGGSMLQEVVVPILMITKKREDTLSKVEVDIINKSNNKITTNILPVKFYQSEAIAERLIGRKIKSYFAISHEGKRDIISDVFTHYFDSAAIRAEDRETTHQFKISTTIQRSTDVYLYMEEQIEGSTQWIDYMQYKFSLTLGMTNDFDSF